MAIPQQFETVVQYLQDAEKKVAEASRKNGDRPWINFVDVVKAGKFDFDKVHEIFSRDGANDEYASLKTNTEALMKDVQTAKLSADFLAGCERDYRMRTRSRVRMFVHAQVVAPASNGDNKGPLRRNTVDWLGRVDAETQE